MAATLLLVRPPLPEASPASDVPAAEVSGRPYPEPVIAVYGDSYTAGTDLGGVGRTNWTRLVRDRLGVRLSAHAAGGAGYLAVSPATQQALGEVVSAAPEPHADIVVVFGSRNDTGQDPALVGQAAAAAYTAIERVTADAQLVVIGPAWSDAAPPADAAQLRDAVGAAADAAGATFVDPLADEWFFDRPDLIAADGVHPTDQGHSYLADKIEPLLADAIGRIPGLPPQ